MIRLIESNNDAFVVRDAGNQRGLGLFARVPLPAGTVLFKEYPIVAMQHLNNHAAGVRVCERCFRFLGPIEEQIRSLLISADRSTASLPTSMPPLPCSIAMPLPIACPGGCALRFCSNECASSNFAEQHHLLCRGIAYQGASSSGLPLQELPDMMEGMEAYPSPIATSIESASDL